MHLVQKRIPGGLKNCLFFFSDCPSWDAEPWLAAWDIIGSWKRQLWASTPGVTFGTGEYHTGSDNHGNHSSAKHHGPGPAWTPEIFETCQSVMHANRIKTQEYLKLLTLAFDTSGWSVLLRLAHHQCGSIPHGHLENAVLVRAANGCHKGLSNNHRLHIYIYIYDIYIYMYVCVCILFYRDM